MIDLQYSELVPRLLVLIPEVRQRYDVAAQRWSPDHVPNHIVYGSVLVGLIESLEQEFVTTGDKSVEATMNRVFNHLEELANSSDIETRCVLETSVIEALLGEKGGLQKFARYMLSATRAIARDVAENWELDDRESLLGDI